MTGADGADGGGGRGVVEDGAAELDCTPKEPLADVVGVLEGACGGVLWVAGLLTDEPDGIGDDTCAVVDEDETGDGLNTLPDLDGPADADLVAGADEAEK